MGQYAKRIRQPVCDWIPGTQVCVGIDPSLNGHAIAILYDGELKFANGWTDKKTLQKKNPQTLNWLKLPPKAKEADRQHRLRVLTDWTRRILNSVVIGTNAVYVAIEGYAYSKRSKGLHGIHGLVEWIKQFLWTRGVPFRIYDPLSIKLAWTGNGHAEKEDMRRACVKHFGLGFANEWKKKGDPGENLVDAVLIAGLLHKELEIRTGRLLLDKVDADTRRVMLRTTKQEPEAAITRDFVAVNCNANSDTAILPDPIYSKITMEAISRYNVTNLGDLK